MSAPADLKEEIGEKVDHQRSDRRRRWYDPKARTAELLSDFRTAVRETA